MPLTDFFPFGTNANDSSMPATLDDFVGPFPLPYILPFFDTNYREIFLGNNGIFSFVNGVNQFIPTSFPLDSGYPIIGVYWADVDTRDHSSNISGIYNKVYYQIHTNSASLIFNKTSSYVQQYFPRERTFQPKMIITGTWYRVGTYPMRTDSLNTFQTVLVTDEVRSFTFFHYHDIQWTYTNSTPSNSFNYAQAGFDAGDGVNFKMLPYSRSPDINKLVNASNVGVPGLFVYRIDSFDIEAGGCEGNTSASNANYSYVPNLGSQLGGTSVNIQGPCFSNETIKCKFGTYEIVDGVILNRFFVRCISPIAEFIGTVDLSVSFDNGTTYTYLGKYMYMAISIDFIGTAKVRNTSNLPANDIISWNQSINIDWSVSPSTYNLLPINSTLKIEYVEFDSEINLNTTNTDASLRIRQVRQLKSDIIPQAGHQSADIDLSHITKKETRLAFLPLTLGFLRLVGPGITLMTSIFIMKHGIADSMCSKWSALQPDPTTWNQDLLPCPYTRTQATVAGCCFTVDPACRLGGNCWFHQGRPEFQEENAVECYRSRGTNAHGAGGQCCYGQDGQLITRGTGAGSDDRYHSTNHIVKHFLGDVLPFIACCKVSNNPNNCNSYLFYRPPRRGSNINPQNGGAWGDPHFETLDGLPYTFNGYGEYIYLALLETQSITPKNASAVFNSSLDYAFMSQIRTAPLGSLENQVTVIKAFAANSNLLDSQPICVMVSRRENLLVYRGNELLDFEPNMDSVDVNGTVTMSFSDITIIAKRIEKTIVLSWPIGVTVEVSLLTITTPKSALVLGIRTSLSSMFLGKTYGLLGNYDGNVTNDLRNKQGEIIHSNSTIEEIHRKFGTSWVIDPTKSMMQYEQNESAVFYAEQNKQYVPLFALPPLSNNSQAYEICHIQPNQSNSTWTTAQMTCYFDYAITKDQAFAEASFLAGQQMQEIRNSQRNPPNFNSSLPLQMNVVKGKKLTIHFQATSELSESIIYGALTLPLNSKLDNRTGIFEWQVPVNFEKDRTAIRVKAQDNVYYLTSTYEVLLIMKGTAAIAPSHIISLSNFILCMVLGAIFHY